jgi:DNA-binding NarL/FixJ family response regulator
MCLLLVRKLAEARETLGGRRLDGRIDVAVVDQGLPDGDGTELIDELRRSSPGVSVVVLSATVRAENVERVRRAGGRRGAG